MAITGFVDLHTHTTASDGLHSPEHNVRMALEAGLTAIAITDHDTVAGVGEAIKEGERCGINVVPGVEVSTVAEGVDIHILGYYVPLEDRRWLERLASLRNVRNLRNKLIVERLNQLGIDVTMNDVRDAANRISSGGKDSKNTDEGSIGRPHIAEALIRKGVVSTMNDAFEHYLAAGAAAYVNPPRLHPRDAIDWIHEAGGVSVIAHPGLYGKDALVEELIQHGAQGIEVWHLDHNEELELRYEALADAYSLIKTGGSDYHGERLGQVFHGAIGSRVVHANVLEQLMKLRQSRG